MEKEKLLLARVSDKIKQYKKSGIIAYTSFLDPAEQVEVESVLRNIPHVFCGGYDDAERKIAIIGESYLGGALADNHHKFGENTGSSEDKLPLKVIRVSSREKLFHRSVLGSVLGLGIAREKVGDIIINENTCDIIVMEELASFIISNMKYVGSEKVKLEEIGLEGILVVEKNIKEIITTVASLRLDSILSSGLGISREKSRALIESERVNVNYKLVTNASKQLNNGDLISIRGYGRIEVAEIRGESRSGRIKVKINKM